MDERLAGKGMAKKLPRISKAFLIMLSLTLLLAANFRFGFSVSVAGKELAGVYAPRQLLMALDAAEAAAREITGKDLNIRDSLSVRPRLTMEEYLPDRLVVERALLDNAPGIIKLCEVRVDGEFVGWVLEQSEFAEILGSLVEERCSAKTIFAGFTKTITVQDSYAPSSAPYSVMEVSRKIRNMNIIQIIDMDEDALAASADGIIS